MKSNPDSDEPNSPYQKHNQSPSLMTRTVITDLIFTVVILSFFVNSISNKIDLPLVIDEVGISLTIFVILMINIKTWKTRVRFGASILLIASIIGLITYLMIGTKPLGIVKNSHPTPTSTSIFPTSTPYSPTITFGPSTPSPTPNLHPPTTTPIHPPTTTPIHPPTTTPIRPPTTTVGADPCPYDNGIYYQTVDGFNSPLLIAGDPGETQRVQTQIINRFASCQSYGHQASAIQVWSYVAQGSNAVTATKQANAIISIMENLSGTDSVFGNTQYSIVTVVEDTKNYAELDVTWRT